MVEGQVETKPDCVTEVGHRPVTILVPTFNNMDFLHRMVNSVLQYTAVDEKSPHYHILIINNGDAGGVSRELTPHPCYTVLDMGENLGWEGGLKAGMEWVKTHTQSPFVMFANDDIQIPPNDMLWMDKMMKTMCVSDKIGVVGPISNMVAAQQNFAHGLNAVPHETALLIGFCMFVRVKALEDVGGIVTGLPGGDDIDLSLRMRAKGWGLVIQGDVFVFHWGEQTGKRVHKDYWNSLEQISTTRNAMIRLHGLKAYMDMLRFPPRPL